MIFICLAIASTAIFTAILSGSGTKFEDFQSSGRTLFQAALAAFDLNAFTDNIAYGGFLLSVFLFVSNVMFLNLLIAMLSNVYSELIVKVDSEHRSVVISYFNRFNWDKKYGFLIFLPSPLSYITLLATPFILCSR